MQFVEQVLIKNGLIVAFLGVGVLMLVAEVISKRIFKKRIPPVAIAIVFALVLAFLAGSYTGGNKGIADLTYFSGFALLGGSMLRDFAIVATAMNASIDEIKKTGWMGLISLLAGITITFFTGAICAYALGFTDAIEMTTIGAGACTFIVGPVTGSAIGASSEIITISIATGVIKTILVTIATPLIAKWIKLDNPQTAMVYGGMIGTTSGVAAGLAATDPKLVPYGALTATFYTGLGCLICPSIFYIILNYFY